LIPISPVIIGACWFGKTTLVFTSRSLGTPPHGAITKSYSMDGCRRVEGAEQRGGDS